MWELFGEILRWSQNFISYKLFIGLYVELSMSGSKGKRSHTSLSLFKTSSSGFGKSKRT